MCFSFLLKKFLFATCIGPVFCWFLTDSTRACLRTCTIPNAFSYTLSIAPYTLPRQIAARATPFFTGSCGHWTWLSCLMYQEKKKEKKNYKEKIGELICDTNSLFYTAGVAPSLSTP